MSTTTEENDGIARPVGEGVDPTMEMFERTPWAQPDHRELMEAIATLADRMELLNTKFDTVLATVMGIADQVGPTIDALRENPLKFLTGKMGGK